MAPVVGMFVFAILFFGIMTDAGMLDPIIDRILRTVGTRPTRIVMGTTLLALLIHLDGSGAVTFLVTIPAMLPLYDRLGMDRRVLACCRVDGGRRQLPALDRADDPRVGGAEASDLGALQSADRGADRRPRLRLPAAYLLGRREEKRLGLTGAAGAMRYAARRELSEEEASCAGRGISGSTSC